MHISLIPLTLNILILITGCAGMKPATVLSADKPGDPVRLPLCNRQMFFTRSDYADIIIKSLKFCSEKKGLPVHACCIPAHFRELTLQTGSLLPALSCDNTWYIVCKKLLRCNVF